MSRRRIVHYQPIVNADGRVCYVEALCPPPAGLSPAELVEHDQWVLATAARQVARWQKRWPGLGLSINVPPSRLLEPGFAQQVARTLRRAKLPTQLLKVELLETEAIDLANEAVNANLASFLANGIKKAMDDMGALGVDGGLGPVTHPYQVAALLDGGSYAWKELFGTVKLDRSLVTDERNRNRLAAFLHLAAQYGLTVVAEGVEELAHLVTVLVMQPGLDLLVQGWLISKKLTARQFVAWQARRDKAATALALAAAPA